MKIATSITIDEELVILLDKRAEEEGRTRSNMIEMILKGVLYKKVVNNKK